MLTHLLVAVAVFGLTAAVLGVSDLAVDLVLRWCPPFRRLVEWVTGDDTD